MKTKHHLYDSDKPGIGGVVCMSLIEDMPGYLFVAFAWPFGIDKGWLPHSLILGLS